MTQHLWTLPLSSLAHCYSWECFYFLGKPSLFLFVTLCSWCSPQSWDSRAWNRFPSASDSWPSTKFVSLFFPFITFLDADPKPWPAFLTLWAYSTLSLKPTSLLPHSCQLSRALLKRHDLTLFLSLSLLLVSVEIYRFSLRLTEEEKWLLHQTMKDVVCSETKWMPQPKNTELGPPQIPCSNEVEISYTFSRKRKKNYKSKHFSNTLVGTLARQDIVKWRQLCYTPLVANWQHCWMFTWWKSGICSYISKDFYLFLTGC